MMQSNTQPPDQSQEQIATGYGVLSNTMPFVVQDVYFRILGQQNIHFSILTVLDYWLDQQTRSTFGNYTIDTKLDRYGKVIAPWLAFRVDDIVLGENFTASLWFWGETTGINTVVSRYRFWKLFVAGGLKANIENRIHGTTSQQFTPLPSSSIIGTGKQGVLSNLQLLKRFKH